MRVVFSKYCFQLQHVSVVNRGHQAACSNVRPMFTAKNMWNLYLGDKTVAWSGWCQLPGRCPVESVKEKPTYTPEN